MPVLSQLSTALTPVVTVTLNGPGLIEGPTDGRQYRFIEDIKALQPVSEISRENGQNLLLYSAFLPLKLKYV